jgi:hypothetical protein
MLQQTVNGAAGGLLPLPALHPNSGLPEFGTLSGRSRINPTSTERGGVRGEAMRGPEKRTVRLERHLRRQATDAETKPWFALRDRWRKLLLDRATGGLSAHLTLSAKLAPHPTLSPQRAVQRAGRGSERAVGSARSPLSIPEFLSTEKAIDIRLLFGASSIRWGHAFKRRSPPDAPALDAMITQQALRRADGASGVSAATPRPPRGAGHCE